MAKLSAAKIDELKKKIVMQFPEFKNVEPNIETKEIAPPLKTISKLGLSTKRVSDRKQKVHIATFGTQLKAEDGSVNPIIVRATLDEDGNILRISHSK